MASTPKPTSEVAMDNLKRLKLLPWPSVSWPEHQRRSADQPLLSQKEERVKRVSQPLKDSWMPTSMCQWWYNYSWFGLNHRWNVSSVSLRCLEMVSSCTCFPVHIQRNENDRKWCPSAYPRTMMSLVSSCETQGLQSQRTRYVAQSLWRKRKVAAIRSRSFILLGPYWTADDSSVVKNSLWNTGGLWLKYLAANLHWIKGRLFMLTCLAANYVLITMTNTW